MYKPCVYVRMFDMKCECEWQKRPKRLTATITKNKYILYHQFIASIFSLASIENVYSVSMLNLVCWNIRPTSPLMHLRKMLIDKIWPPSPRTLVPNINIYIHKNQHTLRQYMTNTQKHNTCSIFLWIPIKFYGAVWIPYNISTRS